LGDSKSPKSLHFEIWIFLRFSSWQNFTNKKKAYWHWVCESVTSETLLQGCPSHWKKYGLEPRIIW
jgi:hypothetical protein